MDSAGQGSAAGPDGPGRAGRPAAGVVGLGTMGGAMARHLLAAGFAVTGYDIAEGAARGFAEAGGIPAASPAEVASRADVLILSLPSVAAFEEVVAGIAAGAGRPGAVVVETSTLPVAAKERGLRVLEGVATLLDCPISGTGAQMAAGDAVFYASGEQAALAAARPVLSACGRQVFEVGAFGNGMKLKLVANHLVAVHNAAAAEALTLAERAGIDPGAALTALTAGAGTSRMLELRGPMMVARDYLPATMKVGIFQKDLDIIGAFARDSGCALPVFAAAAQLNLSALAAGYADHDTASVHAVTRTLSGG